jgi:hypothetical protein
VDLVKEFGESCIWRATMRVQVTSRDHFREEHGPPERTSTSLSEQQGETTMKKRYRGVDLHRDCFTVFTRQKDGSGESREWSIRSVKAFAKTVKANDDVAVAATGSVRLF